jgi:hypothetical protein
LLLREEDDHLILQPIASFADRLEGATQGCFGDTPAAVDRYLDKERGGR